jgi:hypothetical protein
MERTGRHPATTCPSEFDVSSRDIDKIEPTLYGLNDTTVPALHANLAPE